jgi:MFS family permease
VHDGPNAQNPPAPEKSTRFGRAALITLGVIALVLVGFWFSVSVLPRWWSHQVGAQVDGDLTTGGVLGFMYGFLATLLPLLVLGMVFRYWRGSVWAWIVGAAIALLLAAPTLITLGIVLGNGSAAHAAERTLDVEAPWFRGGMAIGVASALLLAGFLGYSILSRHRARRRADESSASLAAVRGSRGEPER